MLSECWVDLSFVLIWLYYVFDPHIKYTQSQRASHPFHIIFRFNPWNGKCPSKCHPLANMYFECTVFPSQRLTATVVLFCFSQFSSKLVGFIIMINNRIIVDVDLFSGGVFLQRRKHTYQCLLFLFSYICRCFFFKLIIGVTFRGDSILVFIDKLLFQSS